MAATTGSATTGVASALLVGGIGLTLLSAGIVLTLLVAGIVLTLLVGGVVLTLWSAAAIPPQVLIPPVFMAMVRVGLADTYRAPVVPRVAPLAVVYVLKRFFDGEPRELKEAAVVHVAGRPRVCWSLMLRWPSRALATVAGVARLAAGGRPVHTASTSESVAVFTFVTTWDNSGGRSWPSATRTR